MQPARARSKLSSAATVYLVRRSSSSRCGRVSSSQDPQRRRCRRGCRSCDSDSTCRPGSSS